MPPTLRKLRRDAQSSIVWTIDRLITRSGAPEVIFLGDSITQFWLEADPWLFWPRRVNRGVSGETTARMLDRFERDVISLRPKVVHIMGGTNDLWHGDPGPDASAAMANLIAMVQAAHSHGIRVILASPPPVAPYAEHMFGYPGLIPVLRAEVEQYCRAAGVHHVDYAPSLADEAGILKRPFTTDGVHLTRRGYRAIRRQAADAVQAALHAHR
jgi:lysophospholipase L1-like esterase